jgi:osmotically-inducible protein OsmY
VKVIARDGAVTLKGPVHSEAEKSNIEAKAVAVAGQGKVNNEIRVIAKKPDS